MVDNYIVDGSTRDGSSFLQDQYDYIEDWEGVQE